MKKGLEYKVYGPHVLREGERKVIDKTTGIFGVFKPTNYTIKITYYNETLEMGQLERESETLQMEQRELLHITIFYITQRNQ